MSDRIYEMNPFTRYNDEELGRWVELLIKRSGHWNSDEMRRKDLQEAKFYLDALYELNRVKMGNNYVVEERHTFLLGKLMKQTYRLGIPFIDILGV